MPWAWFTVRVPAMPRAFWKDAWSSGCRPGFAASAGVTSAYLARAGITGSRAFLQGRYGFYNLYEGGEYDAAPVIKDLGIHFALLDLSVKPYPCCRMTHSAIDAALDLLPRLKRSCGRHQIHNRPCVEDGD